MSTSYDPKHYKPESWEKEFLQWLAEPTSAHNSPSLKSRADLFPPRALALAGEVLAFGEGKHADQKWKTMSVDDHLGAMMRHYLEHQAGNKTDSESLRPHLAHCLVRLAMALDRSLDARD